MQSPGTRDRGDILPGMRSYHIGLARSVTEGAKVKRPVHIIYYRAAEPGIIEIVRVLHERMDAALHIGGIKP